MRRLGKHSSSLSAAGRLSCASARSLLGLGPLAWVPKNLDSSGSTLRRSSGAAVFGCEPAEHGFALNGGTDRFRTDGGSDTAIRARLSNARAGRGAAPYSQDSRRPSQVLRAGRPGPALAQFKARRAVA